jgi:hypothetical protein
MFLLEDHGSRRASSLDELKTIGRFWTIHSPLITSVEHVIREMPGNITARAVFKLVDEGSSHLSEGPFVANIETGGMALEMILDHFEVREIRGSAPDRRLELLWGPKEKAPAWYSFSEISFRMRRLNQHATSRIDRHFDEPGARIRRRRGTLYLPISQISFSRLDNFTAVVAVRQIFLRSSVPVVEHIRSILSDDGFDALARAYIYARLLERLLFVRGLDEADVGTTLEQMSRDLAARGLDIYTPDWGTFSRAAQSSAFRLFDPSAWSQREEFDADFY